MNALRAVDGEHVAQVDARIRLIPFDEIALRPHRRYLIKGLIPRVGMTIVWGPPKSGKSFWVFDAMMHVAIGREYRGRRVQHGPVIYCAFEGQSGLEARVQAFRLRFLDNEPGPIPFYLQPATLDLVADHPALIDVIRRHGDLRPAAVVLDTVNRSLRGSESNDEDMSGYVRAADAVREAFDCAVILVHHCGVETSRPRGHTALTGAADAQIAIKRDGADNIVATVELAKDGPQGDVVLSRLEVEEVGSDEDGEAITSCVVVPAEGETIAGGVKVTGAARTALQLLQKALDDDGEPSPGGPHCPAMGRTTRVSVWRSYCEAGTIADRRPRHGRAAEGQRARAEVHAPGPPRVRGVDRRRSRRTDRVRGRPSHPGCVAGLAVSRGPLDSRRFRSPGRPRGRAPHGARLSTVGRARGAGVGLLGVIGCRNVAAE